MGWELVQAAGGLGLFLFGMTVMTEGLRQLAGASLAALLRRFTRSPTSGAVTGMVATALLQSSSVTTVSAIGFAGAGLLTFRQALGIVFGANVGTTVTGWMVALFGFKLELGLLMPLAVLAGALLRLSGRGRLVGIGTALAGFGLIFIGIDVLRAGMGGFEGVLTPAIFPADDFAGRLQLVGIGMAITLVTQSSSAGVATALVALDSGAISLLQGAALVVGMDMGTTIKAAVATIGASLPARRTGWAHVLFNGFTAVGALVVLPIFFAGLELLLPGAAAREPQLALVAFHSFFNLIGVACVIPFSGPFARLVEWLVPDRPRPFTQRLDRALLPQPDLALRAVAPTLAELVEQSLIELRALLSPPGAPQPERRELLVLALDEVQSYIGRMSPSAPGKAAEARRAAALHVIDQLGRLLYREGQQARVAALGSSAELRRLARRLEATVRAALSDLESSEPALAELRRELEVGRPGFRETTLRSAAATEALVLTDAYRWLERVTHHVWRVAYHLGQLRREVPAARASEPPEPD